MERAHWENDRQVDLTNQSLSGWADAITLDASQNVFVAGQAEPLADLTITGYGPSMIYWKNGAVGNSKLPFLKAYPTIPSSSDQTPQE